MGYRLAFASMLAVSVYAAQKFDVKIVNRQVGETGYSYVVPASSQKTTNTNVNCNGTANSANCAGSTTSTASSTPSQVGSYNVTGATLSLQLPDGRLAVVNCASKINLTEFNNHTRRSCRIPPGDYIQAEFDGDNAKLRWSVSIDGKKFQSETYKILTVIDKP